MIEYDENGYMAGRPVRPDAWPRVSPDLPNGVVINRNAVPPGFLLIQNYLHPMLCNQIVSECDQIEGVPHTVSKLQSDLQSTRGAARASEFIDIRRLQHDIISLIKNTYSATVAPHFGVDIDWFELPEIIRYSAGGEYKPHADADMWYADEKKWKRSIDRDLSILIYLNEGYGGGEIVFPNFGLSLAPKRGLFIAFPSDARYLHAARPVTSGVRYALVSWASVKGGARVQDAPREHSIRM